jgi:hypothetical protein
MNVLDLHGLHKPVSDLCVSTAEGVKAQPFPGLVFLFLPYKNDRI